METMPKTRSVLCLISTSHTANSVVKPQPGIKTTAAVCFRHIEVIYRKLYSARVHICFLSTSALTPPAIVVPICSAVSHSACDVDIGAPHRDADPPMVATYSRVTLMPASLHLFRLFILVTVLFYALIWKSHFYGSHYSPLASNLHAELPAVRSTLIRLTNRANPLQ